MGQAFDGAVEHYRADLVGRYGDQLWMSDPRIALRRGSHGVFGSGVGEQGIGVGLS